MTDNRPTPATRGDTAILPTLYALRLAVLRYAQAYADRRDAPTKAGDQRVADAEQEWTDMHAALYAAATAEAGATGDECQCEACRTGPFRSAPATRDAKAAWAGITNEEAQRVAAVERGVRETTERREGWAVLNRQADFDAAMDWCMENPIPQKVIDDAMLDLSALGFNPREPGIAETVLRKIIGLALYARESDTARSGRAPESCEHGTPFSAHCVKCSGDPR